MTLEIWQTAILVGLMPAVIVLDLLMKVIFDYKIHMFMWISFMLLVAFAVVMH